MEFQHKGEVGRFIRGINDMSQFTLTPEVTINGCAVKGGIARLEGDTKDAKPQTFTGTEGEFVKSGNVGVEIKRLLFVTTFEAQEGRAKEATAPKAEPAPAAKPKPKPAAKGKGEK